MNSAALAGQSLRLSIHSLIGAIAFSSASSLTVAGSDSRLHNGELK